ncbi:MAG: LacI family DNA-binding transcriptional regulator [Propionivibrio sp.]
MKSIAEELKVSRSTVSFVLAGEAERRRINPETARRILERARQLGFRPNYFAQALNTRKTGAIGLVFPDVHEAFMAEMLRGIDEVFARHDVTMMLCSSRMERALELRNIESLLHRGIDGLIIVPCADFHARPSAVPPLAERLADEKLPVVCADRIPPGWNGHAVVQDDHAGALRAVERLVAGGAHRIGCISFDLDASSSRERLAGYRDALARHGLNADARWQVRLDRIDPQADDLSGALRALSALPVAERPDAWFVTTTGLSYRTRELLASLSPGAVLPIARFGADPAFFSSGMISVIQPHHEIGRRAAELLFAAIADPDLAASRIVLPSLLA